MKLAGTLTIYFGICGTWMLTTYAAVTAESEFLMWLALILTTVLVAVARF